MRKLALLAAALVVAGTGGAYADFEKVITIKGGVFFPPVMLAQVGDTVRFVNDDDATHDATAEDNSWTTGPIEPGSEVILTVAADMTACFESSFNDEVKGAFGNTGTGEPPECFELSGEGEENN